MKTFIPLICSLFLIGCSESTSEQIPSSAEPKTAVEANTSTPEQKAPVTETATALPETSDDGGTLFTQKCASCHGAKGEKSALGKSAVIAEFSEQQVKDALRGYQTGTYGKEMKGLMQGQAKALNDAQIDALAKFISAL
ncbi:MAG: c-type cytochrome [Sulfuricurvum sp.]|uniref:c-type cytochrome n=1 Tax=Sulfuricurvum sp. TaxID=2025608 RepID=UPI0027344366|nr:c-type cytochrome [Sulfuricurvum sp.]MDP2851660.1 c-type cytochrome [Sulfuricurvum sp.]